MPRSLLDPIQVEITALYDTAFLLAVTLIFWLVCRHHKLDRPIGILMVITYVCDLIYIILRCTRPSSACRRSLRGVFLCLHAFISIFFTDALPVEKTGIMV